MNANKQDAGGLPSGMVMVQRIDAERLAMSICDEDSASERLSARRVLELCRAAPAGGDVAVGEIGELNGTKLIVGRDEDALARLPKGTKLYTRPQDSAPSGSGEVHHAMNEIETVAWLALRKTPEQLGEEARKELAAREPDWLDTGRLCMGTGKPEWPHNCICPKHAQPHPTDFPHVQRFDWTEEGMELVRPECYGPNEYVRWDDYAALLRKLQQGADYVVVPRIRFEALEASNAEYNAWLDEYHGGGDFTDFLHRYIASQQKEGSS